MKIQLTIIEGTQRGQSKYINISECQSVQDIENLFKKEFECAIDLTKENYYQLFEVTEYNEMKDFGSFPNWEGIVKYINLCEEVSQDVVDSGLELDIQMDLIQDLYHGKYSDEDDFALSTLEDLYNLPISIIAYFNIEDFSTDLFAYDYVISDSGCVFHK